MSNDFATVAKIWKHLKKQNNIQLNIGITGESGSGKSSFVNAFRGIDGRHESAAPTGCVETTTDIKPYSHPNYPNVTLWDLPGVGTTKFPAEKYLKLTGFETFDFFIIISDTRFRENDVKLMKEIQKMGKKFYFVRSKIDNDLRAEERSQRNFNRQKTLTKIRQNCIQGECLPLSLLLVVPDFFSLQTKSLFKMYFVLPFIECQLTNFFRIKK